MKQEINSGHYFEIMDRAYITIDNLESNLYHHPALSKKMRKKLEKVEGLIGEVYQWAWSKYDFLEDK